MKFETCTCPECGAPAIGTLETLTGCALFETHPTPGASVEYGGGTDIYWDGAQTVTEIIEDGPDAGREQVRLVGACGDDWLSVVDWEVPEQVTP